DTRTAPGPYALRSPRPDDRVWSRTGHGAVAHSRSLRRLCASAGIPVADRTRLPLLCDAADRIVWVPGLGVSPFARLGRDTQPILAVARVAPRVGIDLELPAY
ncbi:MAG: tRNA lysidine(34) synthetase TilS C-terminal domain-containing protein, partial [Planctomycetota bacterium]